MADDSVWQDPQVWDGLTTWTTLALAPVFVFLACVLQPDVDVAREVREQWFYSTAPGPHRILAEWHTLWISVASLLGGVAQFLAWRAVPGAWVYPAAMIFFYLSVAAQCAWIAAYFRLVSRFRTARALIAVASLLDALLAGLYSPLDKIAMALVCVRILAHDIPMLWIAKAAVRVHADPANDLPASPRPQREHARTPSPAPPRPRMSFGDVGSLLARERGDEPDP
jgi:hypothetical protein